MSTRPETTTDPDTTHTDPVEASSPTHADPAARHWSKHPLARPLAIMGIGLLLVLALFKFVINPWALDYFMAHPQTSEEIRKENLLKKYDITSIETSTKSAGRGYGGLPASVTYYVVDGVMRDCKITGSTADPVLTCIGWEPPLRGAATPGGLGSNDPATEAPEVSVTETVVP